MSFLRAAVERRARPADYGVDGAGKWLEGMRWQSWGGLSWSVESSMRLSAVYGCLRLISEAVASLPADTFRRQGGARQVYRPRPTYLDFQPPQQSRITYVSQLVLSLLSDGNAFVATPRDSLGVPTDLIPLDPTSVDVFLDERGQVGYSALGHTFTPVEIMHIAGMMLPGQLRGVSPLRAAREVTEGARSAQEYGTSFFGGNAMPPAVIEVPAGANDPEKEQARARRIAEVWHETHGGTQNAGKIGVLTGGAKLTTIAVNPEDSQWLETRRFGVQEIARFYGVPPHLLADASNSTSWGTGLAEQNLAFAQYGLQPWIGRIEDAHGRLLTTHGLDQVFWRLNLDALLRASLSDRYASYAVGISQRFLTINEARRLEDLPPVPWGDSPPAATPPPGG